MPQTNPFHSLVPRKMSDTELARAIRLDLESELDAINLYASHMEATDSEVAKRVILHVMNEEKEHAMLFLELLKSLDPEQAEEAEKAGLKFRLLASGASDEEVEASGGSSPAEDVGAGGRASAGPAPVALTVGSLRRR